MTQINPFTGSILQSPQIQRQQSASKDQQIHRQQILSRNIAAQDDQLQYQVESSEELQKIHEEREEDHKKKGKNNRQRGHAEEENPQEESPPHLDITG